MITKKYSGGAGGNPAEQGNVLFLILIAVALFAALSYAVTRSGRGGGGDASKEKGDIGAAAILQLFSSYDFAVTRLKMSGCKVTQLSTTNLGAAPSMGRRFANANAPVDGRCDVAKSSVAGAKIPASALNPAFQGRPTYGTVFTHHNFGVFGVPNNGNSGYVIVPYVSDAVCHDINRKLFNISTIPFAAGSTTNNYQPWDGSLNAGPGGVDCSASDLGDSKCGGESGCFRIGTFNDFHEDTNASTAGTNVNFAYQRLINGN